MKIRLRDGTGTLELKFLVEDLAPSWCYHKQHVVTGEGFVNHVVVEPLERPIVNRRNPGVHDRRASGGF